MKNREKYAQELIEILLETKTGIAVDAKTGKPFKCEAFDDCERCALHCGDCREEFTGWLNAECKTDTDTVKEIIDFLNARTGKHFRYTNNAARRSISARVNEGYTLDDFKTVIDTKASEWIGTDYERYLTPDTLFGNKFDKYLNQPRAKPKQEDKRSSKWG